MGPHPRYYANPNEQKILIYGLHKYFAYPERSRPRNSVAKETSCFLRRFSPHWTPRAVRLWFNNNRHTYMPPADVRSASPGLAKMLTEAAQPPRQPEAPMYPVVPNQFPGYKAQPPLRLPMAVPPPPPAPAPAEPPETPFKPLNPVSFWQPGAKQETPTDSLYTSMSSVLNEIRQTPDDDPKLPQLIQEFDTGCREIVSKSGRVAADKIEPLFKYVTFDFPSDFRTDLFSSESISELAGFTSRSTSFMGLSFGDLSKDPSMEHFGLPKVSIWQTRPYEDTKIMYFETAAIGDEYAAITSAPFSGTKKTLSYMRYREQNPQWTTISLEVQSPVDSMCISGGTAWVMSSSVVCKVPIDARESYLSTKLPIVGTGGITPYDNGAIATFPASPSIFLFNQRAEYHRLKVPCDGVMCATGINSKIAYAPSQSGTIRLISNTGAEERAFVGHSGRVTAIERLSDSLFASRGEDDTVRVWDIRDRTPKSVVLLPRVSVMSLAGSQDFLICGFHNKKLGVVDLRQCNGKPFLGVHTQDYIAITMRFDQTRDSLAMVGVVEKDSLTNNSIVFIDSDGQSRQRIFRKYSHFLGLESSQ